MNTEDFKKEMKLLLTAYGKEFDKNQIIIWYGFFKEYKKETFRNAIILAINTNKFFPSIAEIKEKIEKSQQIDRLIYQDRISTKEDIEKEKELEELLKNY